MPDFRFLEVNCELTGRAAERRNAKRLRKCHEIYLQDSAREGVYILVFRS